MKKYQVVIMTASLIGGVALFAGISPANSSASREFSPWTMHAESKFAHRIDVHGARAPITITLEPRAVRKVANRDAIDLDVELSNSLGSTLKTVAAFELFDDAGNLVQPRSISPKASIGAGFAASSSTPGASVPADGYYVAKASVAWSGAEGEGTGADYFYFQVSNGHLTPVSADEWHIKSRVSQGVAQ